ncbi:MAG TPA: Asp-tRNA(Asn)/Glu-tRNA(Gln) amidotransferase subunit GatC [Acidobacteriaceae bacterium]|nr:Asp-tRNA(Asn)/Glu-tRNA(Gln) amidotransferase subunit GatC [Acidobacteriaceae bacterium]
MNDIAGGASGSESVSVPGERVTLDQVLRVAELAQLELTPAEQQEMLRDLNSILGHVAQLNELNTTDVPAMAQMSELLRGNSTSGKATERDSALRDDVARPSLERTAVMAQAPETDGTYFKVPKVIER